MFKLRLLCLALKILFQPSIQVEVLEQNMYTVNINKETL